MDFSWTETQRDLRARTEAFAEQQLNFHPDASAPAFPAAHWQACGRFGIQGLHVPTEFGGANEDLLSTIYAMEGLGYACQDTSLLLALNAQMWTVQHTLLQFGSDAQKQRYLPSMVAGNLHGIQAVTEPAAGSDVSAIQTTATQSASGYNLSGSKTMITGAPVADMAIVVASTNPARGKWGLSAFLVDLQQPGVSAGPAKPKMGLANIPLGDLHFDGCELPADARLGPEGAGMSLLNATLEYERSAMLASFLGCMQRQFEDSVAYAKSRQQFGTPIGNFQAVSHRIADMKVRLETARLLLYRAVWLKQCGKSATLETAMVKLHLNECFTQSSMDAINVRGGYGYLTETGVERDLRDAIGGTLYGGTADIQRNIIARLSGL